MMQATTATTTNHVPPLLTVATVTAVIISASATAHGRPLLCALWLSFAWFFDLVLYFCHPVVTHKAKSCCDRRAHQSVCCALHSLLPTTDTNVRFMNHIRCFFELRRHPHDEKDSALLREVLAVFESFTNGANEANADGLRSLLYALGCRDPKVRR